MTPDRRSDGVALAECDDRGGGAQGSRTAASGSPPRQVSAATLLVVALLAGLAVGRFAVADGARVAAPPRAVQTVEERIAGIERRIEARPDDLAALQQLGGLYVLRAGQTGDPAFGRLAERAFDRADAVTPDAVATVTGRATLAGQRHQFDRALALGEAALQERPRDLTAFAVVVDANIELGRYGQAATRLQQMLDIRPALPALSRASYLRELHGDVDGALLAMRQAVTAGAGAPVETAEVTTLLGDLHRNHGDLDAASTAYDRALELAPDLPRAVLGRAEVTAARGDVDGAIGALDRLVERVPLPEAAIALAELQAADGRPAQAAATAEVVRALAALQQAGGQVVDLELALFEADLGRGAQAVTLAERVYAERRTVHAADAMAWSLLQRGDAAAAVPYAEEALRLGTRDALIRYHAAEVFAAAGEPARARAELTAAFEISHWFTWRHRGAAVALANDLGVVPPPGWDRP